MIGDGTAAHEQFVYVVTAENETAALNRVADRIVNDPEDDATQKGTIENHCSPTYEQDLLNEDGSMVYHLSGRDSELTAHPYSTTLINPTRLGATQGHEDMTQQLLWREQMKIEIAGKGINFESPYDNTTVAAEFRRLIESGEMDAGPFGQSLYDGAKKHGKYTANQIPWLHVLIASHEGRPTGPVAAKLTGLVRIVDHLVNCRMSKVNGGKGLLHPCVQLVVGEQTVVLKLAGAKSRNNGKVSVAQDPKFGCGQFYGWIDQQGEFDSKRPVDAVNEILTRVAQDPSRVISEIGKESGKCCYCFANLTTVQSKIAGCGKTCADNYGVDYPNAATTRAFVLDNVEILEGASDAERWEPQTV